MFEAQIAYYLNEYLGKYVEGIDRKSLTISIYAGDVTLKNLQLKPNALDDLDLPVEVRAGLLGSLTLKVPWKNLGGTPVVVNIDQLYILASPKKSRKWKSEEERSPKEFEEAYQQAKMQRVLRKENSWKKGVEKMQKGSQDDDKSRPGFLKGLIDTVIGNLQFSISNIHIRYEDSETRPGHTFTCGFTLEELSASTVDAFGQQAFIASNMMDMLRKSLDLKKLSIYFDCDVAQWEPMEQWGDMENETWQEWFQPDILGSGQKSPRDYVLRPIDGKAIYKRRWKDIDPEMDALTELSVHLEAVEVSLSRDQYCNYSLLLAEISTYTARLPYLGYRPRSRPQPGETARAWWMYVKLALHQISESKHLNWTRVVKLVRVRDKYIRLYKNMLRMKSFKSRRDVQVPDEVYAKYRDGCKELEKMNMDLPECTISMFRRVAISEHEEEREKEKKEEEMRAKQNKGWLGWLMGSQQSQQEPVVTDGTELQSTASLSPQEYSQVLEVLEKQDETMKMKSETPFTIMSKFSFSITTASAILSESTGMHLLSGTLKDIKSETTLFPNTSIYLVSVGFMGMDSRNGVFIETRKQADEALSVKFTRNPQDNSADAVLDATLEPSYVFYDPHVVSNVVQFFKPPDELQIHDLSEISLVAANQLERAKRLAADYAVAAWSGKPRLNMRMALNAPKISIPSDGDDSDVWLALDLGSFVIESDHEAVKSLPQEEKGLYECIRMTGSSISAFLATGDSNWANEQISLTDRESKASSPILEKCGVDIGVQVARLQDPERPMLRLTPSIPALVFHISPSRIRNLVHIMRNVTAGSNNDQTENFRPLKSDWQDSSEWQGSGMMLEWSALHSNAYWNAKKFIIYHSRIYYIDPSSPDSIQGWFDLSTETCVEKVPQEILGKQEILAIYAGRRDWKRILKSSKSLVIKFDSADELKNCHKHILSAMHEISSLGNEEEESRDSADTAQPYVSSIVDIKSSLKELRIVLSGQAPKFRVDGHESQCREEEDLISLRASNGAFNVAYGMAEISVSASLLALEIEDLLSSLDSTKERKMMATSIVKSQNVSRSSEKTCNLAEISLRILSMEHPNYESVDTYLAMNLQSLSLFCNRPTLASLLAFGSDISSAFESPMESQNALQPNFSDPSRESNSSILANEVVLQCQDEEKATFAMDVSFKMLRLVLNYEDEDRSLAEAYINDFDFALKNMSNGCICINTSLGNLELKDLAFDPGRQICGLRDVNQESLISIGFNYYPSRVSNNLAVPPDLDCYFLSARLSKLKVVILYRFILEITSYILTMLQLRPLSEEILEVDNQKEDNMIDLKDDFYSEGDSQPFVLSMDVSMDAPIIVLPESSLSLQSIRADLGCLKLRNSVKFLKGRQMSSLVEQADLSMSGIDLYMSKTDSQEQSIIQQAEKLWAISWQRSLSDHNAKIPFFDLEITIPVLRALLTDLQYYALTQVATSNFSEVFSLPPKASKIQDLVQRDLDRSATENLVGRRNSLSSCLSSPRPSRPRTQDRVKFRITVNLDYVELRLQQERSENTHSLAQLQIANVFVCFLSHESGSTEMSVSIPKLEIMDSRPFAALEKSPVVSSGHTATFMMLEYKSNEESQEVDIILQKPLFIAEIGFLLSLTNFFVPSFEFVKSDEIPFCSFDIYLTEGETFALGQDLWLSSGCRLLADNLQGKYVLDGGGNSLILPSIEDISEAVPLIIIGKDCELVLKNVIIQNSRSLGVCLKVEPGGQLTASPENAVEMHEVASVDFKTRMQPTGLVDGEEIASRIFKVSIVANGFGLHLLNYKDQSLKSFGTLEPTVHAGKETSSIAVMMDLKALYSSHVSSQEFEAQVQGLRASKYKISDLKGELERRLEQDFSDHKKIVGEKASDILLPLRVDLQYKCKKDEIDVQVDVSSVKLLLSPGLLEFSNNLLQDALAPLRQPSPNDPVMAVSQYQKTGSIKYHASTEDSTSKYFGNDLLLTFWRPETRTGYALAGDVMTFGDKPPAFEVLSLARNSGLVFPPLSYELVFEIQGLCFWKPVAPDGYLTAGYVVTQAAQKPEDSSVVCIAHECTTPATFGEQTKLSIRQDEITLINVESSLGTFLAVSDLKHSEIKGVDLRNPIGVTSALLLNQGYIAPDNCRLLDSMEKISKSRSLYEQFCEAQAQRKAAKSRSTNCPKTIDFRRVWTDAGALSKSKGVSVWRPVAPPGYVIMGDCFMQGLDPPSSVHVVKGTMESDSLQQPIVLPPLSYSILWHDGNPKVDLRASFWKPDPPKGYVAMGVVVGIGKLPPKADVFCLREDAAMPAFVPRRPLWIIRKEDQIVSPISVWGIDEQIGSFAVDPSDRVSPPEQIYRLNLKAMEQDIKEHQGSTINAVIRSSNLTAVAFDAFQLPLAKAEIRSLESGIRGYSANVVQTYIGFQPAISVYNRTVSAWEPVLEPFDAIVKIDSNLLDKSESGIDPGMHISFKSSSEIIFSTLSAAHITSVLAAQKEWMVASARDVFAYQGQSISNEATNRITTEIINKVGVAVRIEVEDVEKISSYEITDGGSCTISRPLSQLSSLCSLWSIPRNVSPHTLLLFDLKEVEISDSPFGQIYAKIQWVDCLDSDYIRPHTRSLKSYNGTQFVFEERLILCTEDASKQCKFKLEIWDRKSQQCLGTVDIDANQSQPNENFAYVPLKSLDEKAKVLYSIAWQSQYQGIVSYHNVDLSKRGKRRLGVGRRALSLSGSANWSVIPEAVQRTFQSNLSDSSGQILSLTPLQCGKEDIVLEGKFMGGKFVEIIRSNCQIVNQTEIPLLVGTYNKSDSNKATVVEIGHVFPGDHLALPAQWHSEEHSGTFVCFKLLPNERSQRIRKVSNFEYKWSFDFIRNCQGIDLSSLHEEFVGLLECVPLATSEGLLSQSEPNMSFSASAVIGNVPASTVKEWKILLKPPLVILNHIPMKIELQLEESYDGEVVPRASKSLNTGESMSVHTADMRHSINFKIQTDEHIWSEKAGVALNAPLMSSNFQLQNFVRISKPEAKLPVEIFVNRSLNPFNPDCDSAKATCYGSSLTVTLSSPLWVFNSTTLDIEVAIVPMQDVSQKELNDKKSKPVLSDSFQSIVRTSDASSNRSQIIHLSNSKTLKPSKFDLFSYPFSSNDAGNLGYGIRLRVSGSGWTVPMLLDISGESDKIKFPNLATLRPILIQADSESKSKTFEIVARLEMSEFSECRVLTLDHHLLIENRTSAHLEAFQCQPSVSTIQSRPDDILIPVGGMQFNYDKIDTISRQSPENVATKSKVLCSRSLVQLSANSVENLFNDDEIIDLPDGCPGKPLHLVRGLTEHMLCLRKGRIADISAMTEVKDIPFWSRPIALNVFQEGEHYLVLPFDYDGNRQYVFLVRLRIASRARPGLAAVIIESAFCTPPYVLENRSPIPLLFHQNGWHEAPVHKIEAFSSIGYVPEFTSKNNSGSEKFSIKLYGTGFKSYAQDYVLDHEENDGGSSDAKLVASSSQVCNVHTSFDLYTASTIFGVHNISGDATGFALGRGGVVKVLQIGCGASNIPMDPSQSNRLQSDIYFTAQFPGLSLSIIDSKPQEISLMTVNDLQIFFSVVILPNGTATQVGCTAGSFQMDDQLPGTSLPVSLSPALGSKLDSPILKFQFSTLVTNARGRIIYPYISFRVSERLQLAIHEGLLWHLFHMYDSLSVIVVDPKRQAHRTSKTDAMVLLRLLCVGDSFLSVSFKNEPASRPRSFNQGMIAMVMDVATFQAAQITLKGFEIGHNYISQSNLMDRIFQRLRNELISVIFSLIRNFGVIGGASKVFGFLGARISKFVKDSPSSPTPQPIGDNNQMEASGSSTSQMNQTKLGISQEYTNRPADGARKEGRRFGGAFRGFGKNLVGAFATPLGGALEALSATAEGFDSVFAKDRPSLLVLQRRRLPRVIYGDGKINPVSRNGSDRESMLEALGQSFLWSTILESKSRKLNDLESYEEHFVLPNERVLLFTRHSMLHIFAPGFAQLAGAAEIGSLPAIEIPAGKIEWCLLWTDLLSLELKWKDASLHPDRLVVHRKGLSTAATGRTSSKSITNESLYFDIQCFPKTPQASQIKFIASNLVAKYLQDPIRQDQRWAERHEARATLPDDRPLSDLPTKMPCIEYTFLWNTNPARSPVVYFWKPDPPPGYKPVGVVATLDAEPPLTPVDCFRDDVTLSDASSSTHDGNSNLDTAFPEEYSLIWRYNGTRPVTMWMPVAPKGFVAMGAVIVNAADAPSLDDYVCLKEHLAKQSRPFDSPLWSFDPEAALAKMQASESSRDGKRVPSFAKSFSRAARGSKSEVTSETAVQDISSLSNNWKVSIWQVDNSVRTLLVVRGLKKPPESLSFTLSDD